MPKYTAIIETSVEVTSPSKMAAKRMIVENEPFINAWRADGVSDQSIKSIGSEIKELEVVK